MTAYNVRLKRKQEVAEDTMAFYFDKPEGFTYKAGQFASCTLIDPPETDDEGNTRTFSFASAPCEDELMLATRLRNSAFKRVLKALEPGMELKLNGPHGSFTLHNNAKIPAVFLTGGIGITPVRSIIVQALEDKLPHRILLFYSNRRPEDAAYLEDLEISRDSNPHYTFVATMTQMDKSRREWRGKTGTISKALLEQYIDDLTLPVYYLDGPPAMVEAMHRMLNEAGVDDDNIRTEEFAGY